MKQYIDICALSHWLGEHGNLEIAMGSSLCNLEEELKVDASLGRKKSYAVTTH